MADHLVAAGRRFVQPLRDDQTDEVVPDFVLVDVATPTTVEVWGVTGRDLYELRPRRKRRVYDERSTTLSLLEWNVDDPLPDVERRQPSGSGSLERPRPPAPGSEGVREPVA